MADYIPQTITKALISKISKTPAPDKPREIRDSKNNLILRRQPSGYMGLYVELGRGKRERICDASRVIDEADTLTIGMVRKQADRIRGESAGGHDFKTAREEKASIPTLDQFTFIDTSPKHSKDGAYVAWCRLNHKDGEASPSRIRSRFADLLDLRLDQITADKLTKWQAGRTAKRGTINRDMAALRAALNRGVKLIKAFKANPMASVEPLRVDRNAKPVRALTRAEKDLLIATLIERDDEKRAARARGNAWRAERKQKPLPTVGKFYDVLTPAAIVSMESGLRKGELLSLEWPSVDLSERTITVEGEGAKSFQTRTVPLSKSAHRTLREWWMQQGQPKTGLVFTIDGGRIDRLDKAYHGVLVKAGIDRVNAKGQRLNWHSLRHTFGTLAGAAGVDIVTLKDLMGHADIKTTMRYLHTDEERKRAGIEQMEAMG